MKNNLKKQEIIRAYARVVEKRGIEGASLSAVAQESGITQALIFHYFENKEDMTNQLAQYVAERCGESYKKAWPRGGVHTAETFTEFVTYILRVHHMRRRTLSPKLYFAMLYLEPRQKQVAECFRQLTEELVRSVTAELELFAEAGIIRTPDARLSARSLLGLADGILCYIEFTPKDEQKAFINAQRELFFRSVDFHPAETPDL